MKQHPMQIDRTARVPTPEPQAFCALACKGCSGMCLALYMMLTRDEQDAMRQRYGSGRKTTVH